MFCGIEGHAGRAFDAEAEAGTFGKNDFHNTVTRNS
jgi:hypothetical protein